MSKEVLSAFRVNGIKNLIDSNELADKFEMMVLLKADLEKHKLMRNLKNLCCQQMKKQNK